MYRIVTSGKVKEVTLGEISRNLAISSEVYAIQDGEIYLGVISHKTLVFFATEFAHYALQNYAKKNNPEAEICISLVRKWIEDDTSVSNEELRVVADAAYAAANAAYYDADDATANAADAAANAANAAANAADAAANAADAAANAAANAAGKDREKEVIRQGEFILDFLKSGKHLFLV
jgi:hypothetical protein